VDWKLSEEEDEVFRSWILGPLFQMTSLLVHESRGHFANLNAIGELCAQFRKGVLAMAREEGPDSVIRTVEAYHALHPAAAGNAWYPEAFQDMDAPRWQQLYVNAEHDGKVGVVTISRESYNGDVDAELNRALDWLKTAGIERVILTGDFHLSTQMIGADVSEFFPAVEEEEKGFLISSGWSRTARRLDEEFRVSVGVVNGKRCLGGMLELLMHCHYLVAVNGARLGMPEITLPVIPGMEGCHWPFRKARAEDWGKVLQLLLGGQPVRASEAVGWLIDYAGPLEDSLGMAWTLATEGTGGLPRREVEGGPLQGIPSGVPSLLDTGGPAGRAARSAMMQCIQGACGSTLSEALELQARHSAAFMTSSACKKGEIGAQYTKTMAV
jgi:enoyl-CoA hydratase/carnithine racemase